MRRIVMAILAALGIELETAGELETPSSDVGPTLAPVRGSHHRVTAGPVSLTTVVLLAFLTSGGIVALGTWALGHPLWRSTSTTEVK